MTTFHKMHGLGNDFVVLDLRHQSFEMTAETAREMADRHRGIGCDQILILRPANHVQHTAVFEVWNSDGSRAEQCGNGMRCLGLYLQMQNETRNGQVMLTGAAGDVTIQCLENDMFQVDMGKPVFTPALVPILAEDKDGWYQIETPLGMYQIGAVSMGNPHALMLLDKLEQADIAGIGATISQHSAFPQGCNAGFCEIINRGEIRLRVFERGAAETTACGSGACAAMVILRRAGKIDATVSVTQAGGVLIISWNGGDAPVTMTGPAVYIYKGIIS